jgi:hypothetical protein
LFLRSLFFLKCITYLTGLTTNISLAALLVLNLFSPFFAVEGSYFDRFYKKTADMDPVQVSILIIKIHLCFGNDLFYCPYVQHVCYLQRAAFLEEDDEMEGAHSIAASAGDTDVTTPIPFFLICPLLSTLTLLRNNQLH